MNSANDLKQHTKKLANKISPTSLLSNVNTSSHSFPITLSDGLILNWFFGIDDSFLVQDSVATDGALDGIVCFEFGLLAAVALATDVCHVDQFAVVDLHWLFVL